MQTYKIGDVVVVSSKCPHKPGRYSGAYNKFLGGEKVVISSVGVEGVSITAHLVGERGEVLFTSADHIKPAAKMPKELLKSGMRAHTKGGEIYVVFVDGKEITFCNDAGWDRGENYDNDLKVKSSYDEYDIVKITQPARYAMLNMGVQGPLVWERLPEKTPQQLQIEQLQATIETAKAQIEELVKGE